MPRLVYRPAAQLQFYPPALPDCTRHALWCRATGATPSPCLMGECDVARTRLYCIRATIPCRIVSQRTWQKWRLQRGRLRLSPTAHPKGDPNPKWVTHSEKTASNSIGKHSTYFASEATRNAKMRRTLVSLRRPCNAGPTTTRKGDRQPRRREMAAAAVRPRSPSPRSPPP